MGEKGRGKNQSKNFISKIRLCTYVGNSLESRSHDIRVNNGGSYKRYTQVISNYTDYIYYTCKITGVYSSKKGNDKGYEKRE